MVEGLLDSEASISKLGKECNSLVKNIKAKVKPFYSHIKMAGGKNFSVIGKIRVSVVYNNRQIEMVLYIFL